MIFYIVNLMFILEHTVINIYTVIVELLHSFQSAPQHIRYIFKKKIAKSVSLS